MSLALIQESAKEVRRLAIAGSPLAVGDFRLKKLTAPLEQAGVKVPVFAQVAKAIGDLVDGDEDRSAERLLTLSTLLNAILYTQGQTGIEGTVEELATTPVTGSVTRTPARVLRPLQEALTRTGGGRFEVVKSAVDGGVFHDLRLVDPAIQALGDAYPELADLVAEKVLPGFGPGIASRLKDGLDLKGKKQDARRLEVLHRVDPATALPLCKAALEDGAPDVKAAAIACLGEHEDCLPLVLEQAKAKNKQVKAAALEALAKHDRPEVSDLFVRIARSGDLLEMSEIVRRTKSEALIEAVLAEGSKAAIAAAKNQQSGIERLGVVLHCLETRKDSQVENWLVTLLDQVYFPTNPETPRSIYALSGIPRQIAEMLYRFGSLRGLNSILNRRDHLPTDAFQLIVQTAVRLWPADKVFDEFCPCLRVKKGPEKQRIGALENVMGISLDREAWKNLTQNAAEEMGLNALQAAEWDQRWLDAAISADRSLMVCYVARPGHKGAVAYLLKELASAKQFEVRFLIQGLSRCGYPKLTAVFLDLVTTATKGAKQMNWATGKLFESARHLPAADLPKLEAFAGTLDEKFMEPFLEALAPLRSTAPTA